MPDDAKKPASAATPTGSKIAKLAPAAESGDPAVHQLLAELETARSLGDDAGVQEIIKAIADLGYSAA
jgi:hypothetical protein